ncbi:MAG TPA: hypothetical protein VJ992_09650 [Gemmatimonadales bacterium]|nr:hypothetical protein [Gemmatimonadales bacterium]
MTAAATWLETRRKRLRLSEGIAWALGAFGALLATLAIGAAGGRWLIHHGAPEGLLVAWGLVAMALGAVLWRAWRTVRRITLRALARDVETHGGLRQGALESLAASRPPTGSASLAAAADRAMTAWLTEHGDSALAPATTDGRRAVGWGAGAFVLGGLLFVAARPDVGHAAFWRPFAAIAEARGPVALEVSPASVPRGDSVTVSVRASGRTRATLFVRAPGERWTALALALDSAGRATTRIGPLDADRFVRATSGGRASDTVHVRVLVPAFLADLELVARYPAYLARPDEPLDAASDTLRLPVGTRIVTRGRLSVPIAAVAWRSGSTSVALTADSSGFSGSLPVTRSARWTLDVTSRAHEPLAEAAPVFTIVAVPDSAPIVSVPVPGADTTAPTSLEVPLVADVRDDHLVTRVEVTSLRASALGGRGAPDTQRIALPKGGLERAVLPWTLDLNHRGFLPGDTAYVRVLAWDNAPRPHEGKSRLLALRLPSLADMRAAARNEANDLASAADSLAAAQRDLGQRTEDLAAERDRGTSPSPSPSSTERASSGQGQQKQSLDYRSAQRVGEVASEQEAVIRRAQQLAQRLNELSKQAWSAGLTDPAWHKQLADLQKLLEQAVTPAMRQALDQLQRAMKNLDPNAVRDALKRLAKEQQQLRDELTRSRELFRRAAIEGRLTTLADDAEELARRQQEWNGRAETRADSGQGASERRIAGRTDSLTANLQQLADSLPAAAADSAGAKAVDPAAQAAQAAGHMRSAATASDAGIQPRAATSGLNAFKSLDPVAAELRRRRDQLRSGWRNEVTASLNDALAETADLARRQQQIAKRLDAGKRDADLRSSEAAVRDGVDRVMRRLQDAAGKNALVSPQLGTALGYARAKMTATLDQLQQARANQQVAADAAGQALDGLNTVAYQLVRSRNDVAGAQSGSGLQEAVERMAKLAQQQNGLNGQSEGLLPLMQAGGTELMQELRRLAREQAALGQRLERMRASGDQSGAGALADTARDIAHELSRGTLDRQTVERQQRLFHRLLDAGRTLQGSEEDQHKPRVSRTGRLDNTLVPTGVVPESRGPRFAYPSWETLRRLTPEQRRIILDYFRRLNDASTHH